LNQLQKDLLTHQQQFIKRYNQKFDGVFYKGFSHLFSLELDFDWFTDKLSNIKTISERIDEISTDDNDQFVIKRKEGNIDMYVINVYIDGLYKSVLAVIKTIKESPF